VSERKHRTEVYVLRPREYEMAGCACGNEDPDWSEWWGHLWCPKCQIDFIPAHGGVFDGPIPINTAHMMGLCFATVNIATGEITRCCESCNARYPAQIEAA
jgi:hypothetical protein